MLYSHSHGLNSKQSLSWHNEQNRPIRKGVTKAKLMKSWCNTSDHTSSFYLSAGAINRSHVWIWSENLDRGSDFLVTCDHKKTEYGPKLIFCSKARCRHFISRISWCVMLWIENLHFWRSEIMSDKIRFFHRRSAVLFKTALKTKLKPFEVLNQLILTFLLLTKGRFD